MSILLANRLRSPKKLQNLQKVRILRQNASGPWRRTRRRRRSAFESLQINSTAPSEFFRWFNTFKCGSNRVPSHAIKCVMMGSGEPAVFLFALGCRRWFGWTCWSGVAAVVAWVLLVRCGVQFGVFPPGLVAVCGCGSSRSWLRTGTGGFLSPAVVSWGRLAVPVWAVSLGVGSLFPRGCLLVLVPATRGWGPYGLGGGVGRCPVYPGGASGWCSLFYLVGVWCRLCGVGVLVAWLRGLVVACGVPSGVLAGWGCGGSLVLVLGSGGWSALCGLLLAVFGVALW